MKKLLLVGALVAFVYQAQTSPLDFVALNRASLYSGRTPPPGWQIKVNHGRPDISVCSDVDGPCLQLKSIKASFGLERDVDVDPATMPILSWTWKVSQLPAGGDFRHSATDDQAAQILVAFADHKVVSYIWDSNAPKGSAEHASSVPLVHVFDYVCESGSTDLNRWISESRNLAQDYQHAYGKPAPRVKGLRIQINSQHTGTVAQSYFGDVAFHAAP